MSQDEECGKMLNCLLIKVWAQKTLDRKISIKSEWVDLFSGRVLMRVFTECDKLFYKRRQAEAGVERRTSVLIW